MPFIYNSHSYYASFERSALKVRTRDVRGNRTDSDGVGRMSEGVL